MIHSPGAARIACPASAAARAALGHHRDRPADLPGEGRHRHLAGPVAGEEPKPVEGGRLVSEETAAAGPRMLRGGVRSGPGVAAGVPGSRLRGEPGPAAQPRPADHGRGNRVQLVHGTGGGRC